MPEDYLVVVPRWGRMGKWCLEGAVKGAGWGSGACDRGFGWRGSAWLSIRRHTARHTAGTHVIDGAHTHGLLSTVYYRLSSLPYRCSMPQRGTDFGPAGVLYGVAVAVRQCAIGATAERGAVQEGLFKRCHRGAITFFRLIPERI